MTTCSILTRGGGSKGPRNTTTLGINGNGRYIPGMAEQLDFAGTIVRVEPDGFGIIKFDRPLGPSGNTFGVVSSSTSSSVPLGGLSPGVHVVGTAEPDEREAAAVRTLIITLS